MSLGELVREKREDILQTATKYGAYNVRLLAELHEVRQTQKAILTC